MELLHEHYKLPYNNAVVKETILFMIKNKKRLQLQQKYLLI